MLLTDIHSLLLVADMLFVFDQTMDRHPALPQHVRKGKLS
jgi:hypothetical protein